MGLFFHEILIFLEGDVLIEFGGAFVALGDEVEADTTNVLLGSEVLEVVDLLALDLEFQQAKILQTHLITIAKMATDCLCHTHHQSFEHATTERCTSCSFLKELATLDCLAGQTLNIINIAF